MAILLSFASLVSACDTARESEAFIDETRSIVTFKIKVEEKDEVIVSGEFFIGKIEITSAGKRYLFENRKATTQGALGALKNMKKITQGVHRIEVKLGEVESVAFFEETKEGKVVRLPTKLRLEEMLRKDFESLILRLPYGDFREKHLDFNVASVKKAN